MTPRLFKTRSGLLAFLAAQQGRGRAFNVLVLHDNGCLTRTQGSDACNCKPWFKVRDMSVETHLADLKAQNEWVKGGMS
jgi:hypothetical protein